jgi:hypothetical protein
MTNRRSSSVRSTKAQRWFDRDGLLIGSGGRRYALDERGRVVARFAVEADGSLRLVSGSVTDLAGHFDHTPLSGVCVGYDMHPGEVCGADADEGDYCRDCAHQAWVDEETRFLAYEQNAERAYERAHEVPLDRRGPLMVEDENGQLC